MIPASPNFDRRVTATFARNRGVLESKLFLTLQIYFCVPSITNIVIVLLSTKFLDLKEQFVNL